jgi:hypothetical protein
MKIAYLSDAAFGMGRSETCPTEGRNLYISLQTDLRPVMRPTRNNTRNTKNRILAIPAAAPAIPPNPKTAASIAMIKNIQA